MAQHFALEKMVSKLLRGKRDGVKKGRRKLPKKITEKRGREIFVLRKTR